MWGTLLGRPYNEDYSILWFILESPYLLKLPCIYIYISLSLSLSLSVSLSVSHHGSLQTPCPRIVVGSWIYWQQICITLQSTADSLEGFPWLWYLTPWATSPLRSRSSARVFSTWRSRGTYIPIILVLRTQLCHHAREHGGL